MSSERAAIPGMEDPFSLARRIRARVEDSKDACCQAATGRIKYLWLYVSKEGISDSLVQSTAERPNVDEWLNVIDEAASMGVLGLVVSSEEALSNFPAIWELCSWAQSTHGMCVGIHAVSGSLSELDVARIQQLDASLTRVFLSADALERNRHLEAEGLTLRLAEPDVALQQGGACAMPNDMIYVNPNGVLYTCGMVEGNDKYRLGTIFESRFDHVHEDAEAPRSVPKTDATKPRGCEGCPPMLGRFLLQDD